MNDMCSLCHKKFSLSRNLKRHMIKVHKISSEPQSYGENAKLYKCLDCSSSYRINQNLIYHLETAHGTPIEREELTFENQEDFVKWKLQIEKDESCKYILFGGRAKTDDGPGVMKYVCCKTGTLFKDPSNKKCQDSGMNWACISNIKTIEDPNGDLYVARVKTHYGHDVTSEDEKSSTISLKKKKSGLQKSKNETVVSNESESMEEDDSEDNLFDESRNDNLKEDIKIKFDAVLSSLDKFDNKKLEKINAVLNGICEELDLVTESTNNEVIGTIIISSNSNLDHSYI